MFFFFEHDFKHLVPFPFNKLEMKNQEFLVNKEIEFSIIQVTETGLRKSILDATTPLRVYLKRFNIHDYEYQGQGQECKKGVKTTIITVEKPIETVTSLYRPQTKKGDPRFWVRGLANYAMAGDKIAIIAKDGQLYIIDISQINLEEEFTSSSTIHDYITGLSPYCADVFEKVKNELLEKLKSFSGIWLPASNADTAIGRDIETRLGIRMNSKKLPDYKGIEIKSYQGDGRKGNITLFGQFPDWEELSTLKSSAELLEEIGYPSKDFPSLKTFNKSIKYRSPEKRGGVCIDIKKRDDLFDLLELEKGNLLPTEEGLIYETIQNYARWNLDIVHEELQKKHNRTFWIGVDTNKVSGGKVYKLRHVDYSKTPSISQFDNLLESKIVFLEISLGRWYLDKGGDIKSYGDNFNFRMMQSRRRLLFPTIESIDL